MVLQAATKITKATGSRHTIYLRSELLNDSKFPFKIGQSLIIRIDGDRLILEANKSKGRDGQNE